MNFAALKAKAAAAASDAQYRAKQPSRPVKYAPVRPEDLAGHQLPSASERFEQSTVLQHQRAVNRPPPPPIRSRSGGGTPETSTLGNAASSQVAPPAPARKPALPSRQFSVGTAAPPAPPPRGQAVADGRGIPAPPYQHAVSHDLPKPAPPPRSSPSLATSEVPAPSFGAASVREGGYKKFSEYDSGDKEVMFAMLDEFFESRIRTGQTLPLPTGFVTTSSSLPAAASPGPTPTARKLPPPSPELAPPPIALGTRPAPSTTFPQPPSSSERSYPPATSHSSSALSTAHYLLSPASSPPWWSLPNASLPPPLQSRTDVRFHGGWSQRGSEKSLTGFALFGDASCAWWSISWDVSRPPGGSNGRTEVRYRPSPAPWDGQRLYEASERYGPGMVQFAGESVRNGRPVARGECWDLAAEGLAAVTEQVGGTTGEESYPSIGRTHGHLLYYADARKGGARIQGEWTGGDIYVRAGDVVEWRRVKIREVGMSAGSYSTLGDPDHTAIITSAGTPTSLPALSASFMDSAYPLASLASLTVVEQSLGSAPKERTYDLSTMSEGEIWIYRPVALREYVGLEGGLDDQGAWPPRGETFEV